MDQVQRSPNHDNGNNTLTEAGLRRMYRRSLGLGAHLGHGHVDSMKWIPSRYGKAQQSYEDGADNETRDKGCTRRSAVRHGDRTDPVGAENDEQRQENEKRGQSESYTQH